MERFDGKRCLVTGGGSGMGRAVVLRLLSEGGTVVAGDIIATSLAATDKLAADQGTGERLTTAVVDVADEDQVRRTVDEAVDGMGGLDVVVNAAGILRAAHTEACPLDLWQEVIGVNLTGTFLVARAAIPALLDGGKGVIVNFGSTAAVQAHPYMAAYAASKGGVVALTRTLALEYAKRGLRAVAVAPGGVDTPMVDRLVMPDDADPAWIPRLMPVGGSFGRPEDVAGMVAALASDDGSFVNGTTLVIDGATGA